MYKCIVRNSQGEINANLTLNIQVAPEETAVEATTSTTSIKKTSTTLSSTTVRRKKSVILQCAVSGEQDVRVQWSKDGKSLQTSEETRESRFSVEKKASEVREHETIVQLEIMDASMDDKGMYELVATSESGDKQKQRVVLTEEQIKVSIAEDEEPKKKKKKVVKKKKKKEEKKEIKKPELSSFLKSLVGREFFILHSCKLMAFDAKLNIPDQERGRKHRASMSFRRGDGGRRMHCQVVS